MPCTSRPGAMRRCRRRQWILCALSLIAAHGSGAAADTSDAPSAERSSQITVTATRVPEAVDQIPASISVVPGEELQARDAHDIASALSLTSGVEAPAGGDAGPSSAVASFWGLHEFDAFL